MVLSLIETLRLEVQSIWINKAQYADAERAYNMAKANKNLNPKKKIPSTISQEHELLTPYQGSNRCFGEYKCKPCHRQWQSGWSWANTSQQCQRCKRWVYPYKQRKLEKDEENAGNGREHDFLKCEKCLQIGDCRW